MARYHMAIIDDEEAVFETFDPVPSEIATAISDGLNAFNESAEIRREAFAIVWRENGRLIAGITASFPSRFFSSAICGSKNRCA